MMEQGVKMVCNITEMKEESLIFEIILDLRLWKEHFIMLLSLGGKDQDL